MRSKSLLISALLSTAYVVYLIVYFCGAMASSNTAEAVGGALATALVTPHMVMFTVGAVFSWIGYLTKKHWGALVAAIMYLLGTVLFLVYIMFGLPLTIIAFVGFAKQKKINKKLSEKSVE